MTRANLNVVQGMDPERVCLNNAGCILSTLQRSCVGVRMCGRVCVCAFDCVAIPNCGRLR